MAAKNKFYAIKGSLKAEILDNWADCSAKVHGVKGALYKSFKTREEAEQWIRGGEADQNGTPVNSADEVLIYVDGSFSESVAAEAGWGYVVVQDGREIHRAWGKTAAAALSRNIDGELAATLNAVEWCRQNKTKAVICHDYEGIARWARGEWKAKSQVAQNYQQNLQNKLEGIRFCKVEAHSGDRWNDVADELAKKGIGMV